MTDRTPGRLRVAIVGPVPPLRGGIAQHTGQLARAFEELGHEVVVRSWRSLYPRRLYPGGQQRDEGPPTDAERLRWWAPWTWVDAARLARSCDLVVVPWVVPVHFMAHLTIALGRGPAKLAFFVHNPTPHEGFPFDRQLARLVLGRADGLIAHATAIAEELSDLGITVPAGVVAHPPDIDVSTSAPPSSPPRRLLMLGHLRHYKGTDIGIEAVGRLVRDGVDATLTIAGTPWDETDWLDLARRAGLEGRVEVIGRYVGDDEIDSLLQNHHALVAPYRHATQSGVIALALAAGRPVVCTDVGGLSDLVTHKKNGVVVAEPTAEAVAGGIMLLDHSYDELANGAASTDHRWTDVAAKFIEVVEPQRRVR